MKHLYCLAAAAVIALGLPAPAKAGPETDRLSLCLLQSTAPGDQTVIVRWLFAAMASHPDIRDMATISPAQIETGNRAMGALFERLMTEDCPGELRNAFRAEGDRSIEHAFNILGEKAGTDLMGNPDTAAAILKLMQHVDLAKIGRVLQ